jgi:hypothetical protein
MKYVHEIYTDKKNKTKPQWKAKIEIEVPLSHERMANFIAIGGEDMTDSPAKATAESDRAWFKQNTPILIAAYRHIRLLITKVDITGPKGEIQEGLENLETNQAFSMSFVELGALYCAGFGPGKN